MESSACVDVAPSEQKIKVGDELKLLLTVNSTTSTVSTIDDFKSTDAGGTCVGVDGDTWFHCQVVRVTSNGFEVSRPMVARHASAAECMRMVMRMEQAWSKRVYETVEAIAKENRKFTRAEYRTHLAQLELDSTINGALSAIHDTSSHGTMANGMATGNYYRRGLVEFNRKGGGSDRSYLLLTQYCRTYQSLLNTQGIWSVVISNVDSIGSIRLIGLEADSDASMRMVDGVDPVGILQIVHLK